MKSTSHIPLQLMYLESVSFSLPIHKKALQPALQPFSSKKLTGKGAKYDCQPHLLR